MGHEVGFQQETIEVGPVLPNVQEEAALVTLYNESEFPVEVVSLDFDNRLNEEEDILRTHGVFTDGVMFLPPRDMEVSLLERILGFQAHPPLEPSQEQVKAVEVTAEEDLSSVGSPSDAFKAVVLLIGVTLSGKDGAGEDALGEGPSCPCSM